MVLSILLAWHICVLLCIQPAAHRHLLLLTQPCNQLLLGLYTAAGAIMAGVFSDRIGRRAMLAGCSMLAALCFAGMAVLLSHWLPHLQMQFTPAVAALVVMSSLVEVRTA